MNARAIGTIAVFEVRRYLSERVALFTTILMPVLLVLVVGLSFGPAPERFTVGVLDADRTAQSEAFVALLGESNLDVVTYDDARDLARDIRLGFLSAGVEVEAGFARALSTAGQQAHVRLNLEQASANGGAVATSVRAATEAMSATSRAVRVAESALGATAPGGAVEVAAVAREVAATVIDGTPPITRSTATIGTVREEDRNGFASAVPTQLTLFVFLNGMLAAMTLVESRRLGVSRRILSTPTGVGPHIVGIGAGRWALGLVQAGLLLGLGGLVLGVDFGDPLAVGVLVLVWTALSAAVGMVMGAVARTPDQVVAVSMPVGIGLAMLGGSMWPLDIVPGFMRVLGHLTPHGWANDAWRAIINDGARLPDVATELGILVGSALVLALLAVVLLRRSLSR